MPRGALPLLAALLAEEGIEHGDEQHEQEGVLHDGSRRAVDRPQAVHDGQAGEGPERTGMDQGVRTLNHEVAGHARVDVRQQGQHHGRRRDHVELGRRGFRGGRHQHRQGHQHRHDQHALDWHVVLVGLAEDAREQAIIRGRLGTLRGQQDPATQRAGGTDEGAQADQRAAPATDRLGRRQSERCVGGLQLAIGHHAHDH